MRHSISEQQEQEEEYQPGEALAAAARRVFGNLGGSQR